MEKEKVIGEFAKAIAVEMNKLERKINFDTWCTAVLIAILYIKVFLF